MKQIRRMTHRTIKRVTEDIEKGFQFNTAIAALMEFYNALSRDQSTAPPLRKKNKNIGQPTRKRSTIWSFSSRLSRRICPNPFGRP
ncbi:MAG: class I tRNA ligase family protein [Candidatus Manganitrophus sp.]|nr:class I tRNA ligase family protein [Candidatus Manganitrophus sp.]